MIALTALGLLAWGAWLRVAYYDSVHGHSDEEITVEVVRDLRQSGDWDVNWAKAAVSADLRYDQYNFSSHLWATYFFYRAAKLLPGAEAWRSERGGFLVYRFFSALLATIALAQLWQLGRRLGGDAVGLAALALGVVAVLLVQDARYIRPEPFTTVLTLGAIALAWPAERHHGRRITGAAFCVGLLIACKVSLLMLAWVPFVPVAATWRSAPRPVLRALAAVGGIGAGFALGAPNALAHPEAFLHGVRHLMNQYAGLHPPFSHFDGSPVADLLGRYFGATLGWSAPVLFGAGALALATKREGQKLALLGGPVLVFAGYFATRSVFFERNLSHVLPLFLLVIAFGAVEIGRWAAARWRLSAPLVAAALLAPTLARSATLSFTLTFVDYRGVGRARAIDEEWRLRQRHPDALWQDTMLLVEPTLGELAAELRAHPQSRLLRVADFHDEWTARMLPAFERDFHAERLGVSPSHFGPLPVCTLLAYHRPTYRYYLVTGARAR